MSALLSAASRPSAALQAAEDDPPSAIAPGSARSRPRSRHDARRPCAGAADDNETQREETREPVKLMKVLY